MKKREEMTPEEIQEFMRREEEELNALIGKAKIPMTLPVEEEADGEDEIVSFDPVTGEAVQVESTILTREVEPELKQGPGDYVKAMKPTEVIEVKQALGVFEESLIRKAANELSLEYKEKIWAVQGHIEEMRGFLDNDELETAFELSDEWMRKSRMLNNVGSGIKEMDELSPLLQDLVKKKTQGYAEELMKLL